MENILCARPCFSAPAANFYYGDFGSVLESKAGSKLFKPAIINADYTRMYQTSIIEASDIIYMVERRKLTDVMIVVNFPYNNPRLGYLRGEVDPKMIWKKFSENQRFNLSWNEKWGVYPKCYCYGGTGPRSKTTMMSIIFYRK